MAEFFTEPTGEPTGNGKVERNHSVNFFSVSEPKIYEIHEETAKD